MNLPTPSPSSSASHRPKPLFLAVMLAAMLLLWSFNYIVGKIALRHLDPFSLASFRFELAALIMLPIYFSQRQRSPLRVRDLWPVIYLGFFNTIINQGCFTVGLNYTTSAHSAVIIAIDPIIILLLARALKLEVLTPGKIIGMGLSFAGVLLLETERGSPLHSPLLLGDLISLGSTIGFALFTVLGKRVAKEYDAISMNTFNCVAAAIMILPLAVRQGTHLDWGSVGWAGWAGVFYMAAFSSVVAYTIFYWVLRYMEASRVAVLTYFQPVLVILLSAIFLGDHPTRSLLSGTAFVLFGVYLAERNHRT